MHLDISNVVRVGFEILNLLHGIVVVNPQPHIVRAGYKPLFPRDEFGASHGQFGDFERFDVGAAFVVPNGDVAGVECGEGP